MNHTNHDPFVPRPGLAQLGESALFFLNQHLTLISVGAALLAVALLVVGPLRLLVSRSAQTGASQGGSSIADQAALSGVFDISGNGEAISRQLVPYTIIPDRPRDEVVSYLVQPGDTLIGIAEMFGLDKNSLFWANSASLQGNVHMLMPGVELAILPVDGAMHVSDGAKTIQQIADEYQVSPDAIINSPYNEGMEGFTPDTVPNWGMQIVIPGGTGKEADWRPPIIEVADPDTGTVSYAFMPGMDGSCRAGTAGSGGTGSWAVPVAPGNYAVTQPFGSFHSGIDLAAVPGTPVTAGDTGVVIFSGWVEASWGYGILVVLDHGNGWTSYYAHLSSNGVSCGQLVSRGGYVGAVGSTGNSSGPHLHFEMRWGHTPDNPANYVGF